MASELITTIPELKDHVAIDFISNFDVIEPSVEDRERELKEKYLGEDLFDLLVSYAGGSTSVSISDEDYLAQVLYYSRRAVANLSLMDYMPEGQLNISESGIRINTGEGSMKQAFEWQIKNLQAKYEKTGYLALESLLKYLEENAEHFSTWTESDAYTANKAWFINTAKVFNENFFIDNSRLIFLKLLPDMKKVEEFYIRPAIGDDFFDELKTFILNDNMPTSYSTVISLIRGAVANFTMFHGSDYIPYYKKKGQLEIKKPEELENWGNTYIQKLIYYLNNNASASKFTNFYNSDQYTDPDDYTGNSMYDNDDDDINFYVV